MSMARRVTGDKRRKDSPSPANRQSSLANLGCALSRRCGELLFGGPDERPDSDDPD